MTTIDLPASVELPSRIEVDSMLAEARRQYRRVLAGWASDLLVLRQTDRRLLAWQAGDAEQGWWSEAA